MSAGKSVITITITDQTDGGVFCDVACESASDGHMVAAAKTLLELVANGVDHQGSPSDLIMRIAKLAIEGQDSGYTQIVESLDDEPGSSKRW